MAAPVLIDTDVAIDYLRGHADAVTYIEGLSGNNLISSITVAELYAGVRDGAERTALESFVRAFQVIAIDTAIAERGGLLRRDFGKSHGVGLADALIAASAETKGAIVVTLNAKHFPMLANAHVPYRKP
jgi:predicted nucleic acid-binding protein